MRGKLSKNDNLLAKVLVIGVTVDQIMAEVNAYDWMELRTADIEKVLKDFKERTGFVKSSRLSEAAFAHKFERAIINLSSIVDEVHASYKIPSPKGVQNGQIDAYYYLKYWGDKKNIPLNYNETDLEKRKLFNLYTILFDIFADKLANFNAYNAQNAKK